MYIRGLFRCWCGFEGKIKQTIDDTTRLVKVYFVLFLHSFVILCNVFALYSSQIYREAQNTISLLIRSCASDILE